MGGHDNAVQSRANIDLVDEILPVSLLRCKSALDALAVREQLCIRTNDPVVIRNLKKFIRDKVFRVVHQEKSDDAYLVVIEKQQ